MSANFILHRKRVHEESISNVGSDRRIPTSADVPRINTVRKVVRSTDPQRYPWSVFGVQVMRLQSGRCSSASARLPSALRASRPETKPSASACAKSESGACALAAPLKESMSMSREYIDQGGGPPLSRFFAVSPANPEKRKCFQGCVGGRGGRGAGVALSKFWLHAQGINEQGGGGGHFEGLAAENPCISPRL